MKYLIAGLGNIGAEYENTRHNIGFNIIDELAKINSVSFESGKHAYHCTIKHKGRSLVLIKPTTFMNLSGKAVNHWLQAEKIPVNKLLVLTDDLALPFGTIRIKGKGGDGGHNGLKDIQNILGNNHYVRLRFGIGSEFSRGQQVDYVLGKWSEHEQAQLGERIEKAIEAILAFTTIGLERTMNFYNNK